MKNKNSKRLKAALYARFSPGPNQREESIIGQQRENKLFCEKNNLLPVVEYADRSLTGRTDERPQFQKMIKDAEKGLFDVIVCYKTDRFARDRFDAAVYKNKLKKFGVRVLYSKMSIPEGPEGIILESVLEGLDEYYSKDLAQKVSRGLYDNALEGKACGGPVPYGYKLDENKHFIINENQAPIVKEIFERYSKGEQITLIYQDLNRRGYRTNRNKLWNKNSLHRMFKNKKYIGELHFTSSDENLSDVLLTDKIPPIISKDLFNKVQLLIQTNHKRTRKLSINNNETVDFLLSGKLFDANCGGSFIGDSGTSKTGKTFYYYTCQNKKSKKNNCKTKSIPKDRIEDEIMKITCNDILTDEVINFISETVEELQKKETDYSVLNGLKNELSNINKKLDNFVEAIGNGIWNDKTQGKMVELEKRAEQINAQIKFEEIKISAPKIKKEQMIYFLEQFKNEQSMQNPKYKKHILTSFVDSVIVNEKEKTMIIAYKYTGENDVKEVALPDFQTLKNSFETSVRMSSVMWSLCNDIRTFYINSDTGHFFLKLAA